MNGFAAPRRVAATLAVVWLTCAVVASATVRVVDGDGVGVPEVRVVALRKPVSSDPLASLLPPYADGKTGAQGELPPIPLAADALLVFDHPDFAPLTLPSEAIGTEVHLSPGVTWKDRIRFTGGELAGGEICASWEERFPAWRSTRTWRRCAAVSPDGRFALPGLRRTTVEITVEAKDFLPAQVTRKVGGPIDLILQRGYLLTGRVVDSAAQPIAGAAVRAGANDHTESGQGGSFSLAVPRLPVDLVAEAAGFHRATQRVERAALESAEKRGSIVLRLTPGEQVRGTLVGEQSLPVAVAELRVERRTAAGRRISRRYELPTDGGDFRLDLPGPGWYRIGVGASGYREEEMPELTIASGEVRRLGVITLGHGSGVRGIVLDETTNRPVVGAAIDLLPEGTGLFATLREGRASGTTTDDDGAFETVGLSPGRLELRVRARGHSPLIRSIELDEDRISDLGKLWLDRGVDLEGRVVDRDGVGRSGLIVRIARADLASLLPIGERTTGKDGSFEGPSLSPGRYRALVFGSRLLLSQELAVPEGIDALPVQLVIDAVQLTGLVTRGGRPVAGGTVILSAALDPGLRKGKISIETPAGVAEVGFPETTTSALVDAHGAFSVRDAPSGILALTYVSPGGERTERQVLVPSAPAATLVVDIGGATLRGVVVDAEDGSGVAATVRVVDPIFGREMATARSTASGAFEIADLPSGSYSLDVTAPGYAEKLVAGARPGPDQPPLEIALARGDGGTLAVALQHADGTPVSGALLGLFAPGGRMVRSLPTDGLGRREFADLPAGSYFLAWSDGNAGAGVAGPVEVDAGRRISLTRTLPDGAPVEVICSLPECSGTRVELLALFSSQGIEISPYLSGVAPGLELSASGSVSLGRLSPGLYVLRLWAQGHRWERTFQVTGAPVTLDFSS